jgi:hypothetical protein
MSLTFGMRRELQAVWLLVGVASMLQWCVPTVFGQSAGTSPLVSVDVGSVVQMTTVRIEVKTGHRTYVVQYCGETPYGMPILCSQAARLEVQTPQGWHLAKPRRGLAAIIVDPLPARVRPMLIPPTSERSLVFEFGRWFVDVSPKQQLRVVVDVWPDEQSMRAGRKPTQITSPPFQCPEG